MLFLIILLVLEEEEFKVRATILLTVNLYVSLLSVKALIASGSQRTCISKKFLDVLLIDQPYIEGFPVNCRTIVGALGDKTQIVNE